MGLNCGLKLHTRCRYMFRYGLSLSHFQHSHCLQLILSAIDLFICSPWLVFSNRYSGCSLRNGHCFGLLLAQGRRGQANKLVIMTKIAILFHALCSVWGFWTVLECCECTGQRVKCESGEQSFVRIPQGPLTGLEKEIPLNIMPGGIVTLCSVLLCFMVLLEKNLLWLGF